MRFMANFQRGLLLLPLATVLFVAACGSTSTTSTTGTPTSPPKAGATVAPTVAASTALCNLMSLSQVGVVVGGTLSTLNSGVTKSGTSTSVNCTYLPSQASGEHLVGQISYLFSSDGQASFAANKQDDATRGETETGLSGLGDAAFWAVSSKEPYTLQLSALKGNVLLVMTLLGTNADGSSMLNGAISLTKLALPSI